MIDFKSVPFFFVISFLQVFFLDWVFLIKRKFWGVFLAEKKVVGLKRDVGIQSTTSVDLSSGSPSPAKTPPIMERSLKRHVEADDSPVGFNLKLEGQQQEVYIYTHYHKLSLSNFFLNLDFLLMMG